MIVIAIAFLVIPVDIVRKLIVKNGGNGWDFLRNCLGESKKEEPVSSVCKIDMSKSAENLNKVLIDMSKSGKIDMTKHEAKVALAMDYSGSMDHLYYSGAVQDVISRLLPIAMNLMIMESLESWLFSNGSCQLDPVNI